MSSLDVEKHAEESKVFKQASLDSSYDEQIIAESSPKDLNIFDKFFGVLKAETRGIEIVTEDEKTESSILNGATMWLSANMVIATFSLGALGITVFGISFWQCVLTIIFFNILGAVPVAFFSLFGVQFGLRQMILSKFLVGDLCMRLFAIINCVACVGWGAVNIMASAQLLHIVNNGLLPPWAGCLILILCTILVTFFGYNVIHQYETYSWIPNLAIFLIIIARMSMSGNFAYGEMIGGATTAGGVLSFGGAIFGFAAGWTTYAADYTVYQRKDSNPYKIFFGILAGLVFPLIFTMILGSACATGILTDPAWADLYESNSIGGLVYAILVQDSLHGFGQFCCVVLGLSTVANNIPNMYSIALCAQAFWSPLAKVPRIFWTILGNGITLAICIPAYYHFETVMDNFMNIIGYYLAIYIAISLSEHFIYRKGLWSNYDYKNYMKKEACPPGYAGLFGFACGAAGVVIGMDQVWYAGVVGKKIGMFGGDIGFELAFGFSLIGYNLTRSWEKKVFGR